MSGHKLVAMTFEEASQWIASQEERISTLEAALRAVKLRMHYICHPAEAMWSPNGKPIPDWRKEIQLVEAALSGARTAETKFDVKAANEQLCVDGGHVFPRIPVKECMRCHAQFAASGARTA